MAGLGDTISEMPELYTDATNGNYFDINGKCVNAKGEELTKDIFISTDLSIIPSRNADGSIDMKDLLVLKQAKEQGAVIKETPFKEIAPGVTEYVVKAGDCLARIAKNIYGNEHRWKDIYEWNQDIIKDPTLIRIGQILKLYQ